MTTFSPDAEPAPGFAAFDGHVDLIYALQQAVPVRPFTEAEKGPVTPATLARGQVRIFNSAIYCYDHFNGAAALQHLKQLLFLSETLCADLPVIHTRAELRAAWGNPEETATLLLLENADALVDLGSGPPAAWGVRTIGLTHAGSNRLADGNAVTSPRGLKPLGKALLPELEQGGYVIDVAHLAEPGFWELLDRYGGPLCCSHTGLRRYRDLPRNLSEDQVRAILERNGMVGLAFAPELLGPGAQADADMVFRQLDHLVQRFGHEGFGVGSDLGGYEGTCRDLEDHGRLGNLVERMVRAGYPEMEIRALLGGNWYRFYLEALPEQRF